MIAIYKTTDLTNGMSYIGKDKWDRPNYLGSGIWLNNAIKDHGRENFKKEIICYAIDNEMANLKEEYHISYWRTRKPHGMNIANGGDGGNLGIEVNAKISATMKKLVPCKAFRDHIGIPPLKGKKMSDDQKEKIRLKMVGKVNKLPWTDEQRASISGVNNPNYKHGKYCKETN
jgi:hypothetical protein